MTRSVKREIEILRAKAMIAKEAAEHDHVYHMEKMLVSAFTTPGDQKYFLTAIGATTIAGLTAFLQSIAKGPQSAEEARAKQNWGWLATGLEVGAFLGGGLPGLLIADHIRKDLDPSSDANKGPWGTLAACIEMSSMGIAGACWAYLLIKAVCGDEGIGKVLGSIGALGAVGQ